MSEAYRRAGVDLEAAAAAVDLIKGVAASATRPEVVEGVGGFAGLYRLDDGRMLAAATGGVVPEEVRDLVAGVAEGCRRAGCALLGGETAEHPGTMEAGRFDLAGFCVGLVRRDELLGPDRVKVGDALVGLPASGVHSNGFSLIRAAIAHAGLELRSTPAGLGRALSEGLLEAALIYASAVRAAAATGALRAAAHATGGGLPLNLPRALPEGLGATLDRGGWPRPEVFGFLQRLADVSEEEMFGTFNMGLGMVLVVDRAGAGPVIDAVRAAGLAGSVVGEVTAYPGVALR